VVARGKIKTASRYLRQQHRPTVVHTSAGQQIVVRSALEARWAIFFDTLGLKWKYEPKPCKFYTPDFHVEGIGYVEIKPSVRLLASESQRKIKRFCKEHPKEKLYAFISENVSFDGVALYQDQMLYAVTFTCMAQIIADHRDSKRISRFSSHTDAIKCAFKTANQCKLDHFVPVGASLLELIGNKLIA
jgi:hypothetical protein